MSQYDYDETLSYLFWKINSHNYPNSLPYNSCHLTSEKNKLSAWEKANDGYIKSIMTSQKGDGFFLINDTFNQDVFYTFETLSAIAFEKKILKSLFSKL